MNNIFIRPACYEDLEDLVQFEKSCFMTDCISRKSYQRLLKTSSAIILILKKDDLMIGAAILFFRKKSNKARLYSFAIHNEYRKQGLAGQLNSALEMAATERECFTIFLEVKPDNIAAINFYSKQGYVIFDKYTNFYEDGTDALRMEKVIYATREKIYP